MQVAYTFAPGKGDTDLLLGRVAAALQAQGLIVCGTVQVNTEQPCNGPCDMDVDVLPDGPRVRISQSLGPQSRGCRLDPAALETAVGEVQARLSDQTDVLIVNKFGKHEADGRGFRPVIAQAITQNVPVIVGTNALNVGALQGFVGEFAVEVAPTVEALTSWFQGVGADA